MIQILSQPMVRNLNAVQNAKRIKLRINDYYLNLIPIGLLKIDDKDLGEIYSISYAGLDHEDELIPPSAKNLAAFAATKGNANFSSLPGAKKEIEILKEISNQNRLNSNTFFIDNEFNKDSFLSSFSENNIVHLATHFQVNGNTSDSTRMLLGDGSELNLDQIRNSLTNISSSLITLSACDTASLISNNFGTSVYGSSYFDGLSSVFLTKGAKNVIATLWSIDDEATSDFMGIFYTLLINSSISEVDALYYTQAIFRNQTLKNLPNVVTEQQKLLLKKFTRNITKYSHPYYWSGFQIYTVN